MLFRVATGEAAPLLTSSTRGRRKVVPRVPSASGRRRIPIDLDSLAAWTQGAGVPLLIETFDRRTAGRYITERLLTADRDDDGEPAPVGFLGFSVAGRAGPRPTDPWREKSLSKSRPHSPDTEPVRSPMRSWRHCWQAA